MHLVGFAIEMVGSVSPSMLRISDARFLLLPCFAILICYLSFRIHRSFALHTVLPRSVLYLVKVKVKFTLEQATKAQRGSSGIALFFL